MSPLNDTTVAAASQQSFVLETRPARDVLNKAADVIMAREDGELTLTDRKMWNFLLASTYGRRQQEGGLYRARVSDLMTCISHGSTDRLHESLSRLANAKVAVDYRDARGVQNSMRGHYLSFNIAKSHDGWVHFSFDPVLIGLLYNPRVFGTLSLSCIQKFRSTHALKLYEIISLYINRQKPVWEVSVDDFRLHMALSENYDRFDNLRRRVIEPAIEEVKDLTAFSIEVSYVKAGRGGRVSGMCFTAGRAKVTLQGAAMGAALQSATLSPGQASAPEAADTPGISEEAREAAIARIGETGSYDALLMGWREEVSGLRLRSPDDSFLSWLDLRLAREQDDALGILEDSTLSAILATWDGTYARV